MNFDISQLLSRLGGGQQGSEGGALPGIGGGGIPGLGGGGAAPGGPPAGSGFQLPGMGDGGAPGGLPRAGGAMGGIPPELVQQLLALRGRAGQQGGIDRQRKLADSLRGMASDQLQGQQVGRNYVPPGIANIGANLYAQYQAAQRDKESDAQQAELVKRGGDAAAEYFNRLTRG